MNRFSSIEVPVRGNLLVEASAGTGKTYAITTLFVRLIVERKLTVDQILVVTFTEAATAELRGRIRGRLRAALRAFEARLAGAQSDDAELSALAEASGDPERDRERLALALSEVDEAAVSTIHGFCHRVLTDTAFESGADFEVELLTDARSLRDEVIFDFWARTLADADPREVGALRAQGIHPSTCGRLVDAVLRSPDLRVLPESVERPEPPSVEPAERAFAAMRERWDREAIEGALLACDELKGNLYKPTWIAKWLGEAQGFVAADRPTLGAPDKWMEKLSADVLAASMKKGSLQPEPRHPFFEACAVMRAQAEGHARWAEDYAIWLRRALAEDVRATLPRRKDELGVMAFDDLLLRVDAALRGRGGERLAAAVRRRHPVALVDEFQDTDPVQYRILSRIWPEGTRFFIGDPKQAIYAFRGADVFAYLRAARQVDAARRYTMGVNWRSDPGLLSAVEALFARHPAPFVMEGIDFPPVAPRPGATDAFDPGDARQAIGQAPLSLRFVPRGPDGKMDGDRMAELDDAIAVEIATMLRSTATVQGRPVTPGDVAVLTRTNKEAFAIQRALRRLRVPSVVLGDQSVFEDEHAEAGELQRVLAAVAEPTHSPTVRAALCTELLGLSAGELARLDEQDGGWDGWVTLFRDLNAIWSGRGFIQMIRALLAEADVERRLLRRQDGERRMTNLRHLVELLHTAAVTEHLGPAALIGWLATQRAPDNARQRSETNQVRLESDDRAVKITTVHRSKGLEYPIVYCPYLWDGRLLFNDELNALELHWAGGDGESDEAVIHLAAEKKGAHHRRAEWERLAENARLLYVALTRAKHRSVVVWGAMRRYDKSALGYLLHAPPVADLSVSALSAHLKKLDDGAMQQDLHALVARSEGAVEVRPLGPTQGRPLEPRMEALPALRVRPVTQPVERWWRTASFSELASGGASRAPDEGRDRDQGQAAPMLEAISAARGDRITLLDFPRGARAGTFFHAVLEHLDFTAEPGPERDGLLRRMLRAHGFDRSEADERRATVGRALDEILDTPLEPGSKRRRFRLRDLPASSRLDELEFFLPVASASPQNLVPRGTQLALVFPDDRPRDGAAIPVGRVTAGKLAAVFADHPSDTLDPGYAERVERLDFVPLEGFLKGFIDLVMVVDGRWYVVDYKSNHLGDRRADYAAERLPAAMAHGHYYLQSHLYALAVHRHLSRRLPGYRYEEAFGGIFYLFIKGMHPSSGSKSGVFFDKPPVSRLEALSDALDRPPKLGGER